jgi:hypothetical protein
MKRTFPIALLLPALLGSAYPLFHASADGQKGEKAELERVRQQRTLWYFAEYHKDLEFFRSKVGRYPLTKEGLKALLEKRPELGDHRFYLRNDAYYRGYLKKDGYYEVGHFFAPSDGWEQPIRYTSDGKTYRIEASHGMVLTDKSPVPSPEPYSDFPN